MNSIVVAIGRTGANIASYIQKQNNRSLEIVTIENKDQIDDLKFESDKSIFTISSLGGDSSQNIISLVTQKARDQDLSIKNIIILPFSIESNKDNAIKELENLQSINQNIELYPNDSISDDKNLSMLQVMQLMDEKIYDRVSRENQIKWKSFFIEQIKEDTNYKAFVQYWSKDYKIVLVSPEFKTVATSHMPNMAPSKFAMKNETDDSFIDIEEVAIKSLEKYIQNLS